MCSPRLIGLPHPRFGRFVLKDLLKKLYQQSSARRAVPAFDEMWGSCQIQLTFTRIQKFELD